MKLEINDKRALVFGASSGLGRATAEALIAEKVNVVISSSNSEKCKNTASEIGAKSYVVGDLTKPGGAAGVVKKAIEILGGIDILVINAGGPVKGKLWELDSEQWQEGFQSLWMSALDAINLVVPQMKKNNWGRITIITSISARESLPALTISNGLRAGLLNMVKDLSRDLGQCGININAVLPGYIKTERLAALGVDEAKISAQIPNARLGKPSELADLISFLSSERAAYINGQSIACDGGYLRTV